MTEPKFGGIDFANLKAMYEFTAHKMKVLANDYPDELDPNSEPWKSLVKLNSEVYNEMNRRVEEYIENTK